MKDLAPRTKLRAAKRSNRNQDPCFLPDSEAVIFTPILLSLSQGLIKPLKKLLLLD